MKRCWPKIVMTTFRGRDAAAAFTLLEFLVATAITLVIAGVMLSVTLSTLGFWRRQVAMQGQTAAARQVLDLLERDLQAAVHHPDARRWMAVDILDSATSLANHGWLLGSGLTKPPNGASLLPLGSADAAGTTRIEAARFGLSGAWLRFVTTNVETAGSLPTVVAYQIARRPVLGDAVAGNPAPVRYNFYRSVVSAAETMTNGYDVLAPAYGSTSNTPSSALSTAYRQPRNVTNPSHANLLASNVVDFGCWLYTREASGGLTRIYPSAPDDAVHHAAGDGTSDDSRFPEVADVMVRILSEEGAAQIDSLERRDIPRPPEYLTDADWWWGEVGKHSAVFVRRVEIKGGAP